MAMGHGAKLEKKFIYWQTHNASLPSRLLILNHFILPSVIYFLSCWRPPDSHLKQLIKLTTNFLWGGNWGDRKMHKVSYTTCILPKDSGGLGLMDVVSMADKLSSKWILRSSFHKDYWAYFLKRHCSEFPSIHLKAWKGTPSTVIFYSPSLFRPKGSSITTQFWRAWAKYGNSFQVDDRNRYYYLPQDSIWFSALIPPVDSQYIITAHKLFKMGFHHWEDLWFNDHWATAADLTSFHRLSIGQLNLLLIRIQTISLSFPFCPPSSNPPSQLIFRWKHQHALLPLPNLPSNPVPLFSLLNQKWGLSWSDAQWVYRFKSIWAFAPTMKHTSLLWLLIHRAIWTGKRALQIGKGNGMCKRCHSSIEDVEHLFFFCPFNVKYIDLMHACFKSVHPNPFSIQEILLGICINLDPPFWHIIRSTLIFHIWKERNAYVFAEGEKGHYYAFQANIMKLAVQVEQLIKDAPEDFMATFQEIKAKRWQTWKNTLLSLYSAPRLQMIQGIKEQC